jgi:hypothetical protein
LSFGRQVIAGYNSRQVEHLLSDTMLSGCKGWLAGAANGPEMGNNDQSEDF